MNALSRKAICSVLCVVIVLCAAVARAQEKPDPRTGLTEKHPAVIRAKKAREAAKPVSASILITAAYPKDVIPFGKELSDYVRGPFANALRKRGFKVQYITPYSSDLFNRSPEIRGRTAVVRWGQESSTTGTDWRERVMSRDTYRVTLTLHRKGGTEDPAALLTQMGADFTTHIQKRYRKLHAQWLTEAKKRMKSLNDRVTGAKGVLRHLVDLETREGLAQLDVETIRKQFTTLESQRMELTISLAGKEARQDALSVEIVKLRRRAEKEMKGDDAAKHLRLIIERLEQQLKHVKDLVTAGRAATGELTAIAIEVARAKVQLVERLERVAERSTGGRLVRVNDELASAQTDLRELIARRIAMERIRADLSQRLRESLVLAASLRMEIKTAKPAEGELAATVASRARLAETIELIKPPTITVQKRSVD